jgi:hypothetical protein
MVSPERISSTLAERPDSCPALRRACEQRDFAGPIMPDRDEILTSFALSATLVMDNLLQDVPE